MVIDFHNDTILKVAIDGEDFIKGSDKLHIDLPKIISAKDIEALFFGVCCYGGIKGFSYYDQAMSFVRRLKNVFDLGRPQLKFSTSAKDLEDARKQRSTAAFIGLEGGFAIENDLKKLEKFYIEGVRLITLAYAGDKSWAGSCHDKETYGLTEFGKEVISSMNELGVMIDLAHSSAETISDVVKLTRSPVVSSHSCVDGVYKSSRSLSDDSIRAIADTGGVIAILFFPDLLKARPDNVDIWVSMIQDKLKNFLGDPELTPQDKFIKYHHLYSEAYPKTAQIPDIGAVFEHIDYVVRLVGEDHVGIGSDFDGIPYGCEGLENISQLGNLADCMRSKGYSDMTIEKIMGGNIRRVVNDVL